MSRTEHRTFKDRFSDTTQNPFGSGLPERKLGYGDFNVTWRCENHPIPNDENMMIDAVTSQHCYCTGATVSFVRELGDEDAHLECFIGITKYPQNPRDPRSKEVNQYFSYNNDVIDDCIPLVTFDKEMLEVIDDPVNVYKYDYMLSSFNNNSALNYFEKVGDGAAQSETVLCRGSAFLPYQFVPLVLGKDCTPREAFCRTYPSIKSEDMVDECSGFLRMCQVSATLTEGGMHQQTIQLSAGKPCPRNPFLLSYMKKEVLFRELKGLRPSTAPVASQEVRELKNVVTKLVDNRMNRE